MKLKIGTGTTQKKKKPKQEKEDDYFSDLSDEEIEAIQLEVLKDSIDTEVKESVQTALNMVTPKEEAEEEEIKEAVNGVFVLDEVGIGIKYAEKYASLFPKKKVVYRGLFTKAFLKWYITNVKVSKLKDLYIIESEYVKPEQKDEIMKWITKRLKPPIELEDVGTLASPELVEVPDTVDKGDYNLDLITDLDSEMYEFILSEKWDEDKRAKGIIQLDKILEEQMRLEKCDMGDALKNVMNKFGITSKFGIERKLKKETSMTEEIIEKVEPNVGSHAEKKRELDRSIKRFHHIKFLYDLMGSPKMELVKELSDEETEHILTIDKLLNDTIIIEGKELPAKKSKKTTESIDNFVEGD